MESGLLVEGQTLALALTEPDVATAKTAFAFMCERGKRLSLPGFKGGRLSYNESGRPTSTPTCDFDQMDDLCARVEEMSTCRVQFTAKETRLLHSGRANETTLYNNAVERSSALRMLYELVQYRLGDWHEKHLPTEIESMALQVFLRALRARRM